MTQYYASIIFIGILMIIVSLLWIAFDKKKAEDTEQLLQKKKEELSGIISDAEEMINEMNHFSDYIVTQMDLKNQEMSSNLKEIEEKIKNLSLKAEQALESVPGRNEKVAVNGSRMERYIKHPQTIAVGSDSIGDIDSLDITPVPCSKTSLTYSKSFDKVIPIKNKRMEVIGLAEKGLDETEIAKQLNMGKGEIQLILGMNKSY